MIKTTKGSDRKRSRRGDYWEERDTPGKSHDRRRQWGMRERETYAASRGFQ